MKRLLKLSGFVVLVSFINVVSLLVLIGPSMSTAGPPGAQENGDVNGDQSINMADAVYLLEYLFNGGTPPVAIAQDPLLEAVDIDLDVRVLGHPLILPATRSAELPAGGLELRGGS